MSTRRLGAIPGPRPTVAVAIAWAMGLWAPSVAAAPPVAQDRGLSDGIDRPIHDYSGEGDASSIELNPGLINGVRGIDFVFRGYNAIHDQARGTGYGGFLSLNTGLGVALGVAAQHLGPSFADGLFDEDQAVQLPATKISGVVSTGDRLGKISSIGLGIHGLRRNGAWIRGADLDIGIATRVTRFASVGAVFRFAPLNFSDPRRLRAHQSIMTELAVRPLGTRMVELAGGVNLRADPDDGGFRALGATGVLARGRLALRWEGISLAGEVEQVPVTLLDEGTLAVTQRSAKALRGSVALSVAWDYVLAETGVHAGLSDGVDGVGYAVRLSTARLGRMVPVRPVQVEHIDLAEIDDERSLIDMLERLRRAASAGKRSVLLADVDGFDVGWADARELREALIRVRNAGGHVFAYVEHPSLADYWVASAAEKVFIHPTGELDPHGLAARTFYFKDALAKVGVRAEAEHIDEYKSAHETWTRADRSKADREQRMALLGDNYTTVVAEIATARGKTLSQVRALIDAGPLGPEAARTEGWIDSLTYRDERADQITEAIGKTVELREIPRFDVERQSWSEERYLAVVLVEGTIVDGRSRSIPLLGVRMAGAETLTDTLSELRSDPLCRGIVLRVDSPGGSAMASEKIWRQVHLAHEQWKKEPRRSPPIVVSMGDVAASGGYYVSMGTDAVYAQPTTITGSIGVVSIHYDLSGLLRKLGIHLDTLEKGENPWVKGIFEPWTEAQRRSVQDSMRRTYDTFKTRVADGRKLDPERVHELGRGHVYSGTAAQSLGLVDSLTGLEGALADLRRRAGLRRTTDLPIRVYPRRPTLLQLILRGAGSLVATPSLRAVERRRRRSLSARIEEQMPKVFDATLSRLPLSILYLPQARASTIMPGTIEMR